MVLEESNKETKQDLGELEEDELLSICNKQSERLRNAMEAGNLAWWEMELPSGEVNFSENKAKMLGYSPDKFEHYEDFTDLVHSEDYDKAMKAMRDHLEGRKERYEVEYRLKKQDGGYKWFRDVGSITEENEDYKKVTGVVIDIDARKQAEKGEQLFHEMISKVKKAEQSLENIEFGEETTMMLQFKDMDDLNKFTKEVGEKKNVEIEETEIREDEVVAVVKVSPPTSRSY